MSDKVNIQEIVADKINSYNSLLSKVAADIKLRLQQVKSKLFQARTVIGLDIGTNSIKIAQMARVQGDLVLTKASIVEIDLAKQEDLAQATLNALKKALLEVDTKGAQIICAINCPKTYAKQIITPFMPKQELPEAVRWEMKNQVPYSLDEAVLDFAILGEVADKGLKKLSVAVAVSPKNTIDNQISLMNQLGLKISSIVPHSIALQYLVEKTKSNLSEVIAVVDMGAQLTELNIYKNGRIEFSRKLPVSGIDITKSLTTPLASAQGRVELNMLEAEKIKRDYGMPSEGWMQPIEGKITVGQILSLVRPKIEQLVIEIERSFDFYREAIQGTKVDRVIIYGGSSGLRGLVEFLKSELGMAVNIGNPLDDIKALSLTLRQIEDESPRFNLAIAAALSEAKGINLLPKELKEQTRRYIEKISLKAIVTFAVMLCLLIYIGMRIQYSSLNKKLVALRTEYRGLARQLAELGDGILLEQMLRNRPSAADVLKEVSNVIPENIYLVELSTDEDTIALRGVIIPSSQDTEAVLSNFMLTLEKGMFKNVSLVSTRKKIDNSGESEFEIKCELD